MAQTSGLANYADLREHIWRCPAPIPPEIHARFHDLVEQATEIRRAILDSTAADYDLADLQVWLDELENVSAEACAMCIDQCLHPVELPREDELEMLMDEVYKRVQKLEKRKRSLKKDVKKLSREIKELKKDNHTLRHLLVQHSRTVTAEDCTTLGTLHRDLNLILEVVKKFAVQDGIVDEHKPDVRGGMGGQIEDEEHVCSFAKHKNWDQVDAENAAAQPEVNQKTEDTVEEKNSASPAGPFSTNRTLEPAELHMIYLEDGLNLMSSPLFDNPIIVCHFPYGDSHRSATWNLIMRNHKEKHGTRMEGSHLYKVTPNEPALDHELRQAIISRNPTLHEQIECSFAPEGRSETWIVADQSLAPEPQASLRLRKPTMRGGGGGEDLRHVQVHSEAYVGLVEEFDRLYDQLMLTTLQSCENGPKSICTKAWVSVAKILQLRNRYLERQLEELNEIHGSVVEDVRWNMEMVTTLEDKLQTVEEEKADAFEELGFLRKLMEQKEEKSPGKGKEPMRPANPTPDQERLSQSPVEDKSTTSKRSPTSRARTKPNSILTTCFYFYNLRSVIIVPGSPAQILQFARGTTLKDVQTMLNTQHKRGMQTDQCAASVHRIMDIREQMGIELPESLLDEAVMIGMPETSQAHTTTDDTIKIAAWETVDNQDYVEFVPRTRDDTRVSSKPRTAAVSMKDDHFFQMADIVNSFEYNSVTANEDLSDSICSCNLCASDVLLNKTTRTYQPPIVSVRGGGDEWDDDDYDDDDYDEDGGYGYGVYDSDDDDDEVDHEDEANDPWADYEIDAQDGLGGLNWNLEDTEPSDEQQQPHLRGGASSSRVEWQRAWEDHVRLTRESAPSPTLHMLPARNLTPDFCDEAGNSRDDLWLAYYKQMKKDGNSRGPCYQKNDESPLPL
jgi:hypothetical protein